MCPNKTRNNSLQKVQNLFTRYKIIKKNSSLDLWPTEPKINRGHLLFMTYPFAKYENIIDNR